MTITWQGVAPCPHTPLHMPNTKECIVCWIAHREKDDEDLPFSAPVNDLDYAPDAMYAAERDTA